MLIILFGLSGAGKNFSGEILAEMLGAFFWDADLVVPSRMQKAIKQQKPITQSMRDDLTSTLI